MLISENHETKGIFLLDMAHTRDETYRGLKEITDRLSRKFASPSIEPHVTLIGGFSGDFEHFIYSAETLSKQIKPFTVKLGHPVYLDEFFRSLFIHIEKTPQLLNAYDLACETYKNMGILFDPQGYLPHMSLLYGNLD